MVFSSIPFVFFFLPACLTLYYAAPYRLKNHVLLFFSLLFYAWGEPRFILLLLLATAEAYFGGLLLEKTRSRMGHPCDQRGLGKRPQTPLITCCTVFLTTVQATFHRFLQVLGTFLTG